jgi:hypothetical protein
LELRSIGVPGIEVDPVALARWRAGARARGRKL